MSSPCYYLGASSPPGTTTSLLLPLRPDGPFEPPAPPPPPLSAPLCCCFPGVAATADRAWLRWNVLVRAAVLRMKGSTSCGKERRCTHGDRSGERADDHMLSNYIRHDMFARFTLSRCFRGVSCMTPPWPRLACPRYVYLQRLRSDPSRTTAELLPTLHLPEWGRSTQSGSC